MTKIRRFFNVFSIICLLILNASPGESGENLRETPVVFAVRKAGPAVVNVSSEYEIRKRVSPFGHLGPDNLFDSFFRDFLDPGFERKYKRNSLGSGVIIDGKRGYVLTNAHVVNRASKISVILQDEREFEARVIGADPDSDLSILQISASDPLPSLPMGHSDDLMIGETVIAIGNPFGFSHTVTTGVISAVNRTLRTEDRIFHDFIQIDASINPGNSGGPLLDINGDLIGINTAIYANAQGIGFAIPINKARKIVGDLIQFGEVIVPWIGILTENMDDSVARYHGLSTREGIIVREVESESPAEQAGIKGGDILLSADRRPLHTVDDYEAVLREMSSGATLPLRIWRKGKENEITVVATQYPVEKAGKLSLERLGIAVSDLTPVQRNRYKTEEAVVITRVEEKSYLGRIGVRPGDLIRRIDDLDIRTLSDYNQTLIKYRQKPSLVLLIQREDQLYSITVER